MAYDGTIPALGNLISNDIPAIQENFSLLEDAQIVEHNLGVTDPSNGYYVRWENGLQVCFIKTTFSNYIAATALQYAWTFPAFFSTTNGLHINGAMRQTNISPEDITMHYARDSVTTTTSSDCRFLSVNGSFADGDTVDAMIFAIGRWK